MNLFTKNDMKTIPCWLLVLNLLFGAAANALEPANPNANAKARTVLNYLQGLTTRQDKLLVSGQFVGTGRSTTCG